MTIKKAGSLVECGFYRCYKCNRMIHEGQEYLEYNGRCYCLKCGDKVLIPLKLGRR